MSLVQQLFIEQKVKIDAECKHKVSQINTAIRKAELKTIDEAIE